MLDGRHAHNAWLHELPDPVTQSDVGQLRVSLPRRGAGDSASRTATSSESRPEMVGLRLSCRRSFSPASTTASWPSRSATAARGPNASATSDPPWLVCASAHRACGRQRVGVGHQHRRYAPAISGRPVTVTKTGATHVLASTQMHHSLAVPPLTNRTAPNRARSSRKSTLDELRQPAESHRSRAEHRRRSLARRSSLRGTSLGHGDRPQLLHRLFGLRHRLPGREQRAGRRPGRSAPQARDALDPHRSLLLGRRRRCRRSRTSRCCASTASTRRARRSARCSRRCTATRG